MSTTIKTWEEWLDEFPDGQIITNDDVREAMLKEIDDLRVALSYAELELEDWRFTNKIDELQRSNATLQKQLQELNLQYISDFGQLQEKELPAACRHKKQMWNVQGTSGHCTDCGQELGESTTDTELPGMWESADFLGGATDVSRKSEPTEVRLWDSQWTNVVNHDNGYAFWSTEDAVHHAVKMTEDYIAKNVAGSNLPTSKIKLTLPLSVDALDDLASNFYYSFNITTQMWTFTNEHLFKFARAIEEAHNIKE